MRLDINPFAIDYPEVTLDNDRFDRLFLTFYCKALIVADNNDL